MLRIVDVAMIAGLENDIVKSNDEEKTKQLKKLVTPFILRRNKKEVK